MNFDEWVKFGIEKGWCGAPVCSTHDGIPQSKEEDSLWDDGTDPCIHIIRLYSDKEEQKAVEDNHSPSVWRNTYSANGEKSND